MNVSLSTIKRTIAATEVLLIFPAALFLAALLVRQAQPERYEPAHTAQRIVAWYAARPWTLWVLLIALPFAVLASGSATLLRGWNDDAELRQAAGQTLAAIRAPGDADRRRGDVGIRRRPGDRRRAHAHGLTAATRDECRSASSPRRRLFPLASAHGTPDGPGPRDEIDGAGGPRRQPALQAVSQLDALLRAQ